MRPSLIQCFPHPFTRQWPATGNPATCECRQLYALVSVCCCVPNTHLLVLHESAHLNTNLITSMPKGPKYVDFAINPRTTPEDLCGFLVRAEMAATGHPFSSPPGSGSPLGAPGSEEPSVFSPASPGESRHEALAAAAAPIGASQIRHQSPPLSRSTVAQRQVVVVCLHGIADASPAVQSSLIDLLMFEQVRNHHRAVRVPTLRIVAFCSSRNYAILLPEPLRALFTLSTYVSTLASDSAVVLQTATVFSSSIVNKRFMLEVMTAPDGQSLLETVTLSGSVKRYLRHLLLVLRGSFAPGLSPGALSLRRIPRWMTILKALAILFMPDEELLRSRSPQMRSALLQSYTRSTQSMTFERTTQTATHREATVAHRSMSPETRVAHQQPGGSHSVESRGRRQAGHAAAPAEERSGDNAAIESFSHVVVSPSDIACVLHCLVGHMMTMPREMVPSEGILSATSTMMGNAAGSSSLVDAYARMVNVHRQGNMGFSLQDPALWDAVAASWTLRNLHGIANPSVDPASGLEISMISSGIHRNHSITLCSLDSGEAVGESEWGLHRGHGTWISDNPEQEASVAAPHASHEQYFQTLNNRPLLSVAEAWKWTAANKLSTLDMASTPMLDYWEVREAMRATLLCRSAPAPG
ncbi:hypothetical protein LSCM1_00297 [Leishmania martiniquensis]|uniref:Uncharacterized protein n=1 Tax=Leishmania martiniquensis TaxID=1580590 RepID=A0A836GBP3_9TRYP|nr:hypothetical protein LSCM1_00297 [Leishmania martiniquensis]